MMLTLNRILVRLHPLKLVSNVKPFSRNIYCYNISRSKEKDKEYEKFVENLNVYKGGDVNLHLRNDDGIAIITFDNPLSKNAFTGSMMLKFRDIVNELQNWKQGKCIILQGSNKQFCSGGDLKSFVRHMDTPQHGYLMSKFMQSLTLSFSKLPLVSVSLVQGNALGGGAEILTSSDFRVMQQCAVIGFVQTRLGITTGFGGSTRLVKLIGEKNALKLLMSGSLIKAEEALKIGLADKIINDEDDALDSCIQWLLVEQNLAKINAHLLQNVKKSTIYAGANPVEDSYEFEREVFRKFWMGKMHLDALDKNVKHR